MLLQNIKLINFRNFEKNEFDFDKFLTVIIGENAHGKTNLLESIYFLINGIGFRECKEEELIRYGEILSSVEAFFFEIENRVDYRISLKKQDCKVEKIYQVNKTKKKQTQYLLDHVKVILFSPEQIQIITGPPDSRREYFNKLISSYDFEYKKRLTNYENALRRRNKVFEIFQNDLKLQEELEFWNKYLEEQGCYLTQKRQEYIDYLNMHPYLQNKEFKIEYVKNEITVERLKHVYIDEKRWRRTIIGPQKDEFQIYLKNTWDKNILHFGSRSEQRLAVLWLKNNEIKYYEEKFKKKPILLLDDILSELDTNNRKLVLELITNYQAIITTAEEETLTLIKVQKKIIRF